MSKSRDPEPDVTDEEPGEPNPQPEVEGSSPPEPEQEDRGDPWEQPCPVCGLLGCRRHS